MKSLIYVLCSNKYIMLLVLLSFVLNEMWGARYFLFVASFGLLYVASSAKLKMTDHISGRLFLIFILFAAFWVFGVNTFNFFSFITWTFICSVLFMIGHGVVSNRHDDSYYVGLLLIVALCTGITNLEISIEDMFKNGIVTSGEFISEFSEEKRTSLVALELAALISCLVLFFLSAKEKRLKHLIILGGLLSVIALLCTLHFVSRTALVIAIISLSIGIFYKHMKRKRKAIWSFLILGVIVFLFLRSGLWDMMEMKNESTDLLTGNGRIERMGFWIDEEGNIDSFYGVSNYGEKQYKFAHNFWLDFAKLAGWVSGICLVIFSLLHIRDVWLVYKNRHLSSNLKVVVITMALAIFLAYSVEPVFEGSNHCVYVYFLFCGMISSLKNTKQLMKNTE